MELESWRRMLHQYGGAPEHITTPAAHQQALEIGHELSAQSAESGAPVPVLHAMLALAAAICEAHARDKPVLSLGFIVDPLARRARYDGDPTWAYNLPRRRDLVSNDEFEAAFDLAQEACNAIEIWDQKLGVDRNPLLGTWEVECLAESIKRFGRGAIDHAMNHVHAEGMWAGKLLDSWRYFDYVVETAKAAKAAAAAAQAEAQAASAIDLAKLARIQEIGERTDLSAAQKCSAVGGVLANNGTDAVPSTKQPSPRLPRDPPPASLREADGWGILAQDLVRHGGEDLRTFLSAEAAHHQCNEAEILDTLAEILRRVASGAYGSREEAVKSIVRPTSGPPRKYVTRWRYFGHMIAQVREQQREKAAC
jgi:hypothetical protein